VAEYAIRATATIPAGTPQGSDVTLELTLDNWIVEQVDLEVPRGPAGNMGFYLANNGVTWIPYQAGEYFVWDDHDQSFPVTDYPTGSGWEITGYNTGTYDHDVIVTFHVNAITPTGPDAPDLPLVLTFIETGVRNPDPVVL
jgi:hypothetical protein